MGSGAQHEKPPVDPPLSARNWRLKQVARLARSHRERVESASFVVEGPTLLAEALDAGLAVHEVFVEADAHLDPLIARARAAGAVVADVAPGALARITETVTPRPVVAVVAIPESELVPAASATRLALVLVGVGDPGNAGTLLRTAAAAGAGLLICCEGTADPFSPKCVRAAAGAAFGVPVVTGIAPTDVLTALGDLGFTRLATTATGTLDYDAVPVDAPLAVVLGNEAHGLPDALLGTDGLIDHQVAIPMPGRAESLNVAMAGAVICFDIARRRRHGRADA